MARAVKFRRKTLSLDDDTVEMLKKQSGELHIPESALVRLLLVQNEKEAIKNG